jgi:hypothetical protein
VCVLRRTYVRFTQIESPSLTLFAGLGHTFPHSP